MPLPLVEVAGEREESHMRSFLMVLAAAAILTGGVAAAADTNAFLGFDKNPGDPNPTYPPQYYREFSTNAPGWTKMGGASEFKPSTEGFDKNPGDPNPTYPPDYSKAMNTTKKGWTNMGGD
jgi:hypothetical protein